MIMCIEFYFFVSHSVMKDIGSSCKISKSVSRITKFKHEPSVFHNTMRNTKVEFNSLIIVLNSIKHLERGTSFWL